MKRGDPYEFHSAPTGEVWQYELQSAEKTSYGPRASLRNIENDRLANVTVFSLLKPDNWPSKSYWKRVEA